MKKTAEVKWVKLMTDMFDNRKIKYLRKLPEGNNIVLIWVMLLTMAGRCNAGGMIFLTENVPYDANMLAGELDFDVNTVKLALEALVKLGMIVCDENEFSIVGWEEHQNIEGMEKLREQNRLRQKRWYDKQKALPESNASPNVSLTQPNATEEEGEEEGERDKDNTSSTAVGKEPVKAVFQILLNDGTYFPVTQEDINHWEELYPAVNVSQEIRKMIGWSESNPSKRKTKRGVRTFITNWLSREQDKAPTKQNGNQKPLKAGMGTTEERQAKYGFTPTDFSTM